MPDETQLFCGHEYTVSNLQFAATVEPENKAIQNRLLEAQNLRDHNQPTVPATLRIEKDTNPFLRCEETSVINAATEHSGKKPDEPYEVFAALRSWKDNFSKKQQYLKFHKIRRSHLSWNLFLSIKLAIENTSI